MRLIDADSLIEYAARAKLDSRELIEEMINTAPTINVKADLLTAEDWISKRLRLMSQDLSDLLQDDDRYRNNPLNIELAMKIGVEIGEVIGAIHNSFYKCINKLGEK